MRHDRIIFLLVFLFGTGVGIDRGARDKEQGRGIDKLLVYEALSY